MNSPEPLATTTELPVSPAFDRRPPFSIEAEISVLGGMLIDHDAVVRAVELVNDSMFFREGHRRLYRAMTRLFERGDAVDVITISEELKKTNELEGIGGMEYVAELVEAVPGRGGGYRLARSAREVSVLEVIEAVEDDVRRRTCVLTRKACAAIKPCGVHDLFSNAQDALLEQLAGATIHDVARDSIGDPAGD